MKKLFFIPIILFFGWFFFYSKSHYSPRDFNSIVQQNVAGAIDFFQKIRANQITGKVDLADVENVRNLIKASNASRLSTSLNLNWEEMGPDNVGGRTRAFLIDKDSLSVIYAGGVAGGLWKSTNGGISWKVLFDDYEINTISCITQANNGDIYVGTGEGHYSLGSYNGTGAGGMIGSGIYKSSNRGGSWTRLNSTIPSVLNSYNTAFSFVNEVATSPLNPQRVYASTNNGLLLSDNGGISWLNPIHTVDSNRFCGDVKVASDGTVITCLDGFAYISTSGNDNTFTKISTGASGKLPSSGISRLEFAFSPQDPNYVYACVASNQGDLYGLYKSTNKGGYWNNIAIPSAEPLGGQGSYNNSIVVSATNKDKFYVGGTQLYSCLFNTSTLSPVWTRISVQYPGTQDLYRYVHPDMHCLTTDARVPKNLYVSCDGGIFKTENLNTSDVGGPSFTNLNAGYNVTQFYALSPTAEGGIVGGTQDNGTKYIDIMGGYSQNAKTIGGGDGGYTEASFIDPNVYFATVYYGALSRTFNKGSFGSSFYSKRIEALPNIYESGFASFVTPIALYENFNDTLSHDSINYVIKPTDATNIGGVLSIPSRVAGINSQKKIYFNDTIKVNLSVGQSIRVQDILQSRLAVGFTNSIWLTKHAIDESGPVDWIRIGYNLAPDPQSRFFGQAKILKFSKDGDYLYVGTFDGNLFRFSNLKSITYDDTLTGEIGNAACTIQCRKILSVPSRALCGIAIDPNNNDRVMVTYGNYGNANYVYMSTNASSGNPSFVSIQNNLPPMPVYDALIDMNTSAFLLGTEYGVWSSTDNGTTWSQSAGFPKVPVLCLRQQVHPYSNTVYGTGIIYAATHGRGAWKTKSLVGIQNPNFSSEENVSIGVFPNPAKETITVSYKAILAQKSFLTIYSLSGSIMKTIELKDITNGPHKRQINVEDLPAGIYLIRLSNANKHTTVKFVKSE